MPTARATIPTDRAARYLAQLSSHTGHIGRGLLHRGVGHATPTTEAVTDTTARIKLGDAHCDIAAGPTGLTLHASADDPEGLRRLQDAVTRTVERIGRRDQLAVVWESADPE
jgi:hypothetical protein